MLILLALIGAGALGVVTHFWIRDRSVRGSAVTGSIAVALSAIVYTALTWAGLKENNIWLWVLSIFGSVAVTWVVTSLLTRSRVAADERAREKAGITSS